MNEAGITYKKIQETLVASIQTGIKSSDDILKVINKLSSSIPKKIIAGPAFGRTIWITSLPEDQGTEMEIGFPVTSDFNSGDIKSRMLPNREVLSILHTGPMNQKTETSKKLWDYVTRKGFISDEFIIEIYHDSNNPQGNKIEIQFIIHNWQELFRQHTIRVLGEEIATTITPESLEVEATLESRLDWAKKAIIKVNCHANEEETFDILSSCAHIFPLEPIEKMRLTYEKARETLAPIASIDQVLLMMTKDRAWGKAPVRDGNILIATKNPANREAFEKATTSAEKRRAACFCPIIRNSLDDNTIPQEYCFCSAGWFRRQWEGTLSQPVKVDTLKTVLRGDEVCQFAIQIPETLIW